MPESVNTVEQKTIILASSSPRRQELIRSLGLPVEMMSSDADESTEPGLSPSQVVEELSVRKAEAVRQKMKDRQTSGVIIGSDTIVALSGNEILGKPKDEADAFRMLKAIQGRQHEVYSGVACIDAQSGNQPAKIVGHTVSKVTFRPMSDEEIRAYVKTGEPLDKAGSYGVQGLGAVFIEKIEGDFYSIMGLPLNLLYQMLLKFGISPFQNA